MVPTDLKETIKAAKQSSVHNTQLTEESEAPVCRICWGSEKED